MRRKEKTCHWIDRKNKVKKKKRPGPTSNQENQTETGSKPNKMQVPKTCGTSTKRIPDRTKKQTTDPANNSPKDAESNY